MLYYIILYYIILYHIIFQYILTQYNIKRVFELDIYLYFVSLSSSHSFTPTPISSLYSSFLFFLFIPNQTEKAILASLPPTTAPLNPNTPICEKILFVLLSPDSGFTEIKKTESVTTNNEIIAGE